MYLIVIVCVAGVMAYLLFLFKRPKGEKPPGPRGWPLIGNALDLDLENSHLQFTQLAREHGNIFTVKLFQHRMVILSNAESIRAAFLTEPAATIFSDRPSVFVARVLFNKNSGIAFAHPGYRPKTLRKHGHRLLKAYGEGIERIERIASEELKRVVGKFQGRKESSFDPSEIVFTSVANTMCMLLVGRTHDDNDREIKVIRNLVHNANKVFEPIASYLLTMFPFLQYFPPYRSIVQDAIKSRIEVIDLFVNYSKDNLDKNHVRGIVDELLLNSALSKDDIEATTNDFISGGILTTHTAIMCINLNLINHRNAQSRIQSEIDDVIGTSRMSANRDRPNMPYTEAVIFETLRYSSHVPLGLFHSSTEDAFLNGYFVEKDAMILMNTWAVHHDERVWGDPWKFRPERFLNYNGELLPLDHLFRKSLLTFGVGKRSCLGEQVARIRMFMFTTSILQRFELVSGDASTPSPDPNLFEPGVIIIPRTFKIRAIARN